MEAITDESYGVVPVSYTPAGWRVLLVHQISYRGPNDRFWTFPKGHAESGESVEETALRELTEETGIEHVTFIDGAIFKTNYDFVHAGKRVFKSVTYLLGNCSDTNTHISLPHEIAAVSWFTFEEARERATHDTVKIVLQEVELYLKNNL